uniref:Uncharacterized protein n=1 Tax=Sphaerodactylus townsendi TaxID=933632 RepID=A0ACB8FGP3_9SAUR
MVEINRETIVLMMEGFSERVTQIMSAVELSELEEEDASHDHKRRNCTVHLDFPLWIEAELLCSRRKVHLIYVLFGSLIFHQVYSRQRLIESHSHIGPVEPQWHWGRRQLLFSRGDFSEVLCEEGPEQPWAGLQLAQRAEKSATLKAKPKSQQRRSPPRPPSKSGLEESEKSEAAKHPAPTGRLSEAQPSQLRPEETRKWLLPARSHSMRPEERPQSPAALGTRRS